ncbi:hypothetical protein C2845_PM08G10300 [Panicum miliaceum]|uniref:Uncharacterized protein n=1 Tax=Panicum miliaceum TaxID=4540 RepID=A0A3L6R1W1_PANMI|nr:hypothetical protein C2845_PM08G10300 [Panicum miliaceum]
MELLESVRTAGAAAYRALLHTDSRRSPPVTCVVADGIMPFVVSVAEEMGARPDADVPHGEHVSAAFLAYLSVPRLLELGETHVPSDEQVRGVPGMEGILRRRDLPRVVPHQRSPRPRPRPRPRSAVTQWHCHSVSSEHVDGKQRVEVGRRMGELLTSTRNHLVRIRRFSLSLNKG